MTPAFGDRASGFPKAHPALEIGALCSGIALVLFSQASMPLWVAALINTTAFSPTQAGRISSAELFSVAVGIAVATLVNFARRPKPIILGAAIVVVMANLFVRPTAFPTLVLMRSINGLAIGTISAIATPLAACRSDSQRVLTFATGAGLLVVSVLYLFSAGLVQAFGWQGIFRALAALAVLTAATLWIGLPRSGLDAPTSKLIGFKGTGMSALACLAHAFVFLGQSSIFIFIVTIGETLGFSALSVGRALAVALPLTMLAPVAAHLVGRRQGLILPILASVALLAVDVLLLVRVHSFTLFCVAIVGLNLLYMFAQIYSTALVGQLDRSGRFVNILGFALIGVAALGPLLVGKVIVSDGIEATGTYAAGCVLLGLLLFLLVAALRRPKGLSAFPSKPA